MPDMPLLVTVDVEGVVATDDFRSVDLLGELLEALALETTLFVTPAVIRRHPERLAEWQEQGHSVGLHLHPGRLGGESDWLGTYDSEAISGFLERGSAVFENHVGHEPTLFRAGRWSFSDELLRALAETGFRYDASHRPSSNREPYRRHGVSELPMSVYGNALVCSLLSRRTIDGIPLHADAFLRSAWRAVPFYGITSLVARQDRPYMMVSFHDYDLFDSSVSERIHRFLHRLGDRFDATTIPAFAASHNV